MSRAIIKEFFKKKIEEGGDVDTILEWNKELCYMFPEDIHESEVVFQSKRITELEDRIKTYKKALELLAIQYSYFFHSGKDCPFNDEELSWCEDLTNRIDCSKECVQRYFLSKARKRKYDR